MFDTGAKGGTGADGRSSRPALTTGTGTTLGEGSSASRFFEMASCKRAMNSEAVDSRSLGSSENAAENAARNFPASMPGMVVNNRVS
jgi:hypothetical protein